MFHALLMKKLLTLALTGLLAIPAFSADYPTRPIKMLVGFPAGGPLDIAARRLGTEMSVFLGQPIVIDNKPGVTGIIAMNQLKRSPADGYTLALATTPVMAIAPVLNPAQRFDAVEDFTPVARFAEFSLALVVREKSPYQALGQLIDAAKKNPGKVTYASAGVGGTTHIAGEMLARATGTKMIHIPYKGTAPAKADLLGGHVDFMFELTNSAQPYLAGGQMRALAVTSEKRNALLPKVPTLSQEGLRDTTLTGWFGIFAPAGLPLEILTRLESSIGRATREPRLQAYVTEGGLDMVFAPSAEFRRTIADDVVFWKNKLDDLGIRP